MRLPASLHLYCAPHSPGRTKVSAKENERNLFLKEARREILFLRFIIRVKAEDAVLDGAERVKCGTQS